MITSQKTGWGERFIEINQLNFFKTIKLLSFLTTKSMRLIHYNLLLVIENASKQGMKTIEVFKTIFGSR